MESEGLTEMEPEQQCRPETCVKVGNERNRLDIDILFRAEDEPVQTQPNDHQGATHPLKAL